MARELEPDASKALATARVITAALAMACVLYVLVAQLVLSSQQAPPTVDQPLLVPLLLTMAAMGLLAAPFVRSAMIRRTEARGLTPWFVSVVVGHALREGAAVMGLVLTLMTGRMWPVMACAGVAVGAILLAWPRRDDLEEHLRR